MTRRGGFDDQAAKALIGVFRAPREEFAGRLGRFIEGERIPMPSIGKLQQRRVLAATFEFADDEWEVKFRPYNAEEIGTAVDGNLDGMVHLLVSVLREWNLTDEHLVPFPITDETLRSLDYDFVQVMTTAVIEVMNVPKPSASASKGSLRRVV